jgi:hypothetical protein
VTVDGRTYPLAFRSHALDRIAERADSSCPKLVAISSVYPLFGCQVCFEFGERRGKPGVWLWDQVRGSSDSGALLLAALLGVQYEMTPIEYQVRRGFFPLEIRGRYAQCATMLTPAMADYKANSNLLSMKNLLSLQFDQDGQPRSNEFAWEELRELHERLPLLRPMPK